MHELLTRDSSVLRVLVTGESGTGKIFLAPRLHDLSPRTAGLFIGIRRKTLREKIRARSERSGSS